VQITRNQLDDVRQPVLSNWRNHVNRNLIFDVLTVAIVTHSACVNPSRVGILRVHHSIVLFGFLCGLHVCFFSNVKLGTRLINIFVAHNSCFDIDIEALTSWGKVCSDLV